jgi:hypothetical protein
MPLLVKLCRLVVPGMRRLCVLRADSRGDVLHAGGMGGVSQSGGGGWVVRRSQTA